MDNVTPNLIKPGDLAAEFKVSLTTLRNWENAKIIPVAVRTPGGHRRYNESHRTAISAYLTKPDAGPPST
jgi:DNA-binding transcriptional MerR regulator